MLGLVAAVVVIPIGVIALSSVIVGFWFVHRVVASATAATAPGLEPGLLRVTAFVHVGVERLMVAMVRELPIGHDDGELAYGQLFWQTEGREVTTSGRLLLRSHSMLGRGLLAVLSMRRAPGGTLVRFGVVRLPGDEQVRESVLRFEMALVAALRRIDQQAEVRLSGVSLREIDQGESIDGVSAPAALDE